LEEDCRLRDILIHQYFGIDAELIWDIIKNKLTALENQIRAIEKAKDANLGMDSAVGLFIYEITTRSRHFFDAGTPCFIPAR